MAKNIMAIDPGHTKSAYVITSDYKILEAGKEPNADIRIVIENACELLGIKEVCIESIQSYGMAVGKDIFDTCIEIGRFIEVAESVGAEVYLYPRPAVARALVGGMKYSDTLVRRALLNRFGGDKKGEPLNLLKGGGSDKRSAFAVAVYHLDRLACWQYN